MPAPGNDTIGDRFRTLRGSRTLAQMGEHVGLTGAAWQRYEEGRVPRGDLLQQIADACGVTVAWILTGKEALIVSDPPAPYGLGRSEAAIVRELEALLEVADEDIKKHLRQQIALLWRAVKTTKKRKAGGD